MLIAVAGGVVMSLLGLSPLVPIAWPSAPAPDPAAIVTRVQRYEHVLLLAQVFSGLWMFPFGWLVLRSVRSG